MQPRIPGRHERSFGEYGNDVYDNYVVRLSARGRLRTAKEPRAVDAKHEDITNRARLVSPYTESELTIAIATRSRAVTTFGR